MDECCRGKWTPCYLEALDEAILIQADKLVSYDRDPVAHYGEGHGYVVVRRKRQVNLDAVYCFEQAREDFYDGLFPLERLWEGAAPL